MAPNNPKVLVADDQRGMRLTLEGIFDERGYQVTGVENGYQAIEAARETQYDLIFMDIKMPGINGVQTYREIKKICPGSVVVMMTGFAMEELVREALEEGAFSVIYKPFDAEEVVKLVESVYRPVAVLVIDERSADGSSLRRALADKGYTVAEASDEDQALEMIKGRQYDVVMIDTRMTGKDGVSTFQAIKSVDPEASVIFTSGFPVDESTTTTLEVGVDPETYMPIDAAHILATLQRSAVEKRR